MKTKLLKRVRNEKRFIIEHRGHVRGYYYSGWWFCDDLIMKRSVKHKNLRNVLNWLMNVYKWQFGIKAVGYVVFSGLLLVTAWQIIKLINQSK